MVDEHDAFEVVHLVLEACRHHAGEMLLVVVAIKVLILDRARGRAIDVCVDFGKREATFLIGRHFFAFRRDYRIDEYPRLFLGGRMGVLVSVVLALDRLSIGIFGLKIDDEHTLGHRDLDRGQTDAWRIVHGFKHVLDEGFQFVVELFGFNRFGHEFEPGVRHFNDFADSHAFDLVIEVVRGKRKRSIKVIEIAHPAATKPASWQVSLPSRLREGLGVGLYPTGRRALSACASVPSSR